jgi:trypsin
MLDAIRLGVLCLCVVYAGTVPAAAITSGTADGAAHPGVGLIMYRYELFHPDLGTYYVHFGFCTGTLVAPDLLLTAAHCVYTEEPNIPILWVSFDNRYSFYDIPSRPDPQEPMPNQPRVRIRSIQVSPAFRPNSLGQDAGNTDLAVVALDLASATGPLPEPTPMAPAGLLDRLKRDHALRGSKFTSVGYGVDVHFGGGPPGPLPTFERRAAVSEFRALGPAYVVLSQNPTLDDGGTCYGDSGGPDFVRFDDGSEVLAAVTIGGDNVCRATNVDVRLDTSAARQFLASVPGFPLP